MSGTTKQRIIVLENFYDDGRVIREHALSLAFSKKQRATYPGLEAVSDRSWSEERTRLATYIHESVDGPCPKVPPFPQGKFRIAVESDQQVRVDGVHTDLQPWSAVVYLTPFPDKRVVPAIGFYKHKETGAVEADEEWKEFLNKRLQLHAVDREEGHRRFWSYMREESHWEEVDRVGNRFNQAILLYARRFHASVGLFGDRPENGRLTQHFEFYY